MSSQRPQRARRSSQPAEADDAALARRLQAEEEAGLRADSEAAVPPKRKRGSATPSAADLRASITPFAKYVQGPLQYTLTMRLPGALHHSCC
eukprot:2189798-Prymnesium_polylepis.1